MNKYTILVSKEGRPKTYIVASSRKSIDTKDFWKYVTRYFRTTNKHIIYETGYMKDANTLHLGLDGIGKKKPLIIATYSRKAVST